ncbi:polysaccharide biosynthesis/export family protein [bacterium]|nr:polysaccharide biosynthesis/export family protein [bacterium]
MSDTTVSSRGTTAGPYLLRIGDTIDVDFLTDAQLDFSGPITPAGTVSVPLAGEVAVVGRTVVEVAADIELLMAPYLFDPTVAIVVTAVAEQPIFVIGEVERPGRILSAGEMTVTRALAEAGGMLSTGRSSSVMVIRTTGVAEPEAHRVDITRILSGRDMSGDMVLAPNDVVYVPKSVIGQIGEFVDLFFDNIAPAQIFYLRGWDIANISDDGRRYY